ncbi:sushi, von Willebrand factor type A, EGF and pentraxin domain-containing protein 1-like isoform X2 [Acropora millepora]|uniref:sushi, von Willebrand factor type A, EGF and pentraxin domain-containing protein 1-like isoform X2 n=1 Tax=Acropora millepora TaxID=45264 RepID=UPI001CF324E6|nr:sushi, von Willebrand factor type A, EGF and pentraxin domain-containing protein 1-like isoform X2 [Acropora millepora]
MLKRETAFRDTKEQKTFCELLPSDKYSKRNLFSASQQYHHFSIMNSCLNNPCKNDAPCLAQYRRNSFRCDCATGFVGKLCETEITYHWKLDGTDEQINLRGAAKFLLQDGETVLYLNGSQGTFAETPAVPIYTENLTICVWFKSMADLANNQLPIYGDWSAPHSFRLVVENGIFKIQVRDTNGVDLIIIHSASSSVPRNRWSHVAMTWNRATRRVRLFVNGEVKYESTVAPDKNINFMNSGHSVYDIGLKRDTRTFVHAYFSDLMIFTRELGFSSSENVNEIKDEIFLTHPLHNLV